MIADADDVIGKAVLQTIIQLGSVTGERHMGHSAFQHWKCAHKHGAVDGGMGTLSQDPGRQSRVTALQERASFGVEDHFVHITRHGARALGDLGIRPERVLERKRLAEVEHARVRIERRPELHRAASVVGEDHKDCRVIRRQWSRRL